MNDELDMINEVPSGSPEFRTVLAEQLAELAPEAIADGKIDVEKLKELLEGDASDTSERYGLFWPGKKRAMRAAQMPTTATLKPDKENSKDWDTTKNVFIEGDNLEVLKILQKHYHGKIKMIYIDPPYNTGNEFVYPDNFSDGIKGYLTWSQQLDEDGRKIRNNTESEGRYHSNWLNMMYPRLKLARNLLSDEGLIFISIDEHEGDNLSKICKEIYGESNYVGTISWLKKRKGSFLSKGIVSMHEYVLVFSRKPNPRLFGGRPDESESQPLVKRTNSHSNLMFPAGSVSTKLPDGLYRSGVYGEGTSSVELINDVAVKDGIFRNDFKLSGPFIWTQLNLDLQLSKGARVVINTKNLQPRVFKAPDEKAHKGLSSVIHGVEIGATNEDAYEQGAEIFGQARILDYPKPVNLISHLVKAATEFERDSIVLDFFAGSGTTAHAVMKLNAEDGGFRRYIQVQVNEPTPPKSEARKAGFKDVSSISRERIRRAAESIRVGYTGHQLSDRLTEIDLGFRAFKLADTSFTKWRTESNTDATELEQHLFDLRDSSDDNATPEDLLTEILIKQGHSLVERIRDVEIDGLPLKSVVRIDEEEGEEDTLVLAYLYEHTKPALKQLRAAVDTKPAQFIILEDAFQGDDELKTNLAQMCKTSGVELWTA